MKLSPLLILLSALMLAGCNTLGNSPSIEGPDASNNTIDNEEQENPVATSLYTNPKYLSLLDFIEQLRVFDEENADYLLSEAKAANYSPEGILSLKIALEGCSQVVEDLYGRTRSLLNGEKSIDEYLYSLLQSRFNYLTAREKCINNSLKCTPASFTYPTSKQLLKFLIKDTTNPQLKDLYELSRLCEVYRFGILNLLIKESFSKCTLAELQPETINLLRASKQLHPLLMDEPSVLPGHPDQAGGPFAILEPIVIEPKQQTDRSTCGKRLHKLLDVSSLEKDIAQKHGSENINPNEILLIRLFNELKRHEQHCNQYHDKMRNAGIANHNPIESLGIPQKKGGDQAKNQKPTNKTSERITKRKLQKEKKKEDKNKKKQEAQEAAISIEITTEFCYLKQDLDLEIYGGYLRNKLLSQMKSSSTQEKPFEGTWRELPDPPFLKPQQVRDEPTYNKFSEKYVYKKP